MMQSADSTAASNTKAKDSLNAPIKGPAAKDSIKNIAVSFDNYREWKAYWKAFKDAARKKDTAKLLSLISFPFLQNADTFGIVDFKESFFSQLNGMQKANEPIDAYGMPLQGSNQVSPIDSVRYTNFKDKDYYFGKVNGFYKLVQIITPG